MPREIPDLVLSIMAEKFRMLSEPTRLIILRALIVSGELSVTQIVEQAGSTQANVSKHLKQLAEAGLVARRKEGLNSLYRLDDPIVQRICHLVCDTILNELEEQAKRNRKLVRMNKKG